MPGKKNVPSDADLSLYRSTDPLKPVATHNRQFAERSSGFECLAQLTFFIIENSLLQVW